MTRKFYNIKKEILFYIERDMELNIIYNDNNKKVLFDRLINKRDVTFGIYPSYYGSNNGKKNFFLHMVKYNNNELVYHEHGFNLYHLIPNEYYEEYKNKFKLK